MAELAVHEVATATSGRVRGDGEARIRGIVIDSRRIEGGELFFALAGSRVDGHAYVAAALARGAAAAVVSQPVDAPADAVLIEVDDTYQALHALTRSVRRRIPGKLAAITGSVGKTTTKELLAAMLARRFRTAKSPGNLNNLYGFPIALLGIPDDTEWMVAEMGMSTPGELGEISRLGRPDVAVYTCIRPVHLENFPDLRGIADAKAELLSGLSADGVMIANADDPWVMRIAAEFPGRVVRYGHGPDAELRSRDVEPRGDGKIGYRFRLETEDEDGVVVELPLHGQYNVDNALAAAACAWQVGVPLADIAAALAAVEPASMRGEVHRLARLGVTVVDDSYNANPAAVERALESAAALPAERRVAVLGDMLELGDDSERFHRETGEAAVRLGFERVIAVGPLARSLAAAADAAGGWTHHFDDAETAASWVDRALESHTIGSGDVVLVKGSRGIGLERVVHACLDREQEISGETA
ncbi:MAG: UDP-N-acetylmuramoyl-tripeptide--D-alanyl-D-alanine ligase [Acidobacteriota bacterium]